MAKFQKGNAGGPGRPRKAEKYAGQIAKTEDAIADKLPKLLTVMFKLALGGYKQVSEEWEPSAVVTVGSGEFESRAFPDLEPDELVRTKRRVSVAAPDRAAAQYLIDRILGKTTQRTEIDLDPDGTLEIGAEALQQAAHELEQWRKQMTTQLNSQSAPLMPPTGVTPTE